MSEKKNIAYTFEKNGKKLKEPFNFYIIKERISNVEKYIGC